MSHARNLARLARRGVIEVDTAADVRALALYGAYPEIVYTRGATAKGDGGHARWVWVETSEGVDLGDPAPVIKPTGHTGAGRYEIDFGGDVLVECFGLPTVASGGNAAQAWTDAGLYAWRKGLRRVTLRSRRDGMALWGLIQASYVTYDLAGSIMIPYVPPVPEQDLDAHTLTVFGCGEAVRFPTAFVDRYNLRAWNNVNAMIDNPDMNIDHRYLHPGVGAGYNPLTTFYEFKSGMGIAFDPRGREVFTEGASGLVPGQLVVLFRPYYPDAINQAGARFNRVLAVDGERVLLEFPLGFPFRREHCDPSRTDPQTVWGGIATVPDNFALIDSHITNFSLDCSAVPATKHNVTVWRGGQALGCSITDFDVWGGEYYFGLFPKGRYNRIGGLRKASGRPSTIFGRGSMVANDQFNANLWEDLVVQLKDWTVEYPGAGYPSLPGHFAERCSARLHRVKFIGPAYDANTPANNGADLTSGSIHNEVIDCHFHNVTWSPLCFTQIEGYGELIGKGNEFSGSMQGPLFGVGLPDNIGDGSVVSRQRALTLDANDFRVSTRPDALAALTDIRYGDICLSTDALVRGNTIKVTDPDTGGDVLWGTYEGIYTISYPGSESVDPSPSNIQYISPRLLFDSNNGMPELRWRRFGVADIDATGTKDVANDRIILAANDLTYFRLSVNEPDMQCAAMIYVLRITDPSGAGGVASIQGTLFAATTAAPTVPSLISSKPGITALAVAATGALQRLALPVVRGGSIGYIPVGSFNLYRRGADASDTAGDLHLRGVDVLFLGGR